MTIILLGETCGIEFETENITSFQLNKLKDMWNVTHDASIESDAYMLNNGMILKNNNFRNIPTRRVIVGTEIVSNILNSGSEDFKQTIIELTNIIQEAGEPAEGLRSGIHFHFSLPNPNLRILKSILRLGRYFETLFFTIGCMGYEFRGLKNDSIYCRPITFEGPPCVVGSDGRNYQCYNIKDALKAKNIDEFWEIFGDLKNHSGRYNPIRYSWLNIYPLAPWGDYRGTLEFRIFNKTLNPLFIYAAAILCKKFLELALISSYDTLKENSLTRINSIFDKEIKKENIKEHLFTLANMVDMDKDVVQILLNIIDQSEIPYLNSYYVFTHIRPNRYEPYWNRSTFYKPQPIIDRQIRSPQYVDIHILRGEN